MGEELSVYDTRADDSGIGQQLLEILWLWVLLCGLAA